MEAYCTITNVTLLLIKTLFVFCFESFIIFFIKQLLISFSVVSVTSYNAHCTYILKQSFHQILADRSPELINFIPTTESSMSMFCQSYSNINVAKSIDIVREYQFNFYLQMITQISVSDQSGILLVDIVSKIIYHLIAVCCCHSKQEGKKVVRQTFMHLKEEHQRKGIYSQSMWPSKHKILKISIYRVVANEGHTESGSNLINF